LQEEHLFTYNPILETAFALANFDQILGL